MFFVEFGAVLHHHRFSIVLTSSSGSASHLGMVLARTALLHSLSLWTAFCGLQLQQFQGATVSWASLWSCHEIQPVTFFFHHLLINCTGSPTDIDKCLSSPRLSLFPGKKLPTVVCNGMFFTIVINLCKHCSYPLVRCISLKNEWSIEVRSVQHWFWEEQLLLRPVWCLGRASSGKTALKKSLFTL